MQPFISIITPSFNSGRFIESTIKSVLDQKYPNLEHIIVDGGSKDNTLQIFKKYPHLKIIIEEDNGQADAVNKGLEIARGDIIGWLNADDTYYTDTLFQVAKHIHPHKGIYIVMGLCAYIDEHGKLTGKEHPSSFTGHSGVVKIWKGYTIPQPAVFFHRHVYEECGALDRNLYFALDYDLFLRYSKRFNILPVNQFWATYRLHKASKTAELSQGELLEKSVEISKRFWGSPTTLGYWNYLISYYIYGGMIGIRSLKRLNKAEKSYDNMNLLGFLGNLTLSFLLFPPTVFRYVVLPRIRQSISKRIW